MRGPARILKLHWLGEDSALRRAIYQTDAYKWWVYSTIGLALFFTVLDYGSVNVAMPTIETYFDADLATVQWVVIGYALVISVLVLPMGRLGDMLNRKSVYLAGLVLFSLGAGLAGTSQSLAMLIGFKALQGVGSAMVQANGNAIVLSVFPGSERGKALGLNMAVVGSGVIVGSALGGILVGQFGWRSVFFLASGAGLVALTSSSMILDRRRLAPQAADGPARRYDWIGAAMSGGALFLFLLSMNSAHRIGWSSPPIMLGLLGAASLLGAFIWWELRHPAPMLDLRLFKRKLVALGAATGWISFMGFGSITLMMSFYLQRILGYSPSEVGLIMIPGAFAMVVLGPPTGRLSDRYGWVKFNVAGLAISATGLFLLSTNLTTSSTLAFIIPMLVVTSSGIGLFSSPNLNSIISAVERSRYGIVTALTQLMRESAQVTSIAVMTAIVVATMASRGFEPSLTEVTAGSSGGVAEAFVDGFRLGCLALGSLLVLGIVLSYLKGERPKEPREEVTAPVAAKVSD